MDSDFLAACLHGTVSSWNDAVVGGAGGAERGGEGKRCPEHTLRTKLWFWFSSSPCPCSATQDAGLTPSCATDEKDKVQ